MPSNKTKKLGEATWALPWKQEEFVAQAVKAGHPKSLHGNLPTPLLYSLDAHLSLTEEDICSRRIRWAKKWTHEIAHCEAEESCFKSQLPENSRRILKVDLVGSLLCAWFSRCEAASKPSLLWSRTFDLKSAYRQLPLSEDAFRHADLSVFCPETKQPSLFQLKCLPFGATASVSHFLRAAYSLWFLGCASGLLIWTSYFDDFWCMSPPNLSPSAGAIAELIFGAKEGAKHVSFSQVVSVLGISIDLSHSKDGRCLFANTEKRISELKQSLSKCLEEGTLSKAMSLQLRGRLGFCESQTFGRVGNLAMKSLIDHAYRVPFKKTIGRCKQDILRLLDRCGSFSRMPRLNLEKIRL